MIQCNVCVSRGRLNEFGTTEVVDDVARMMLDLEEKCCEGKGFFFFWKG